MGTDFDFVKTTQVLETCVVWAEGTGATGVRLPGRRVVLHYRLAVRDMSRRTLSI
ncbi:hypothetical protein JXQ31_14895 [candidate division KSB1 bacterium]|nr:hypothetical protein [candidate division KSB1 bacterium]